MPLEGITGTAKSVVGFVGSASRPSRTRMLVERAARQTAERSGSAVEVFDLLDAGREFGSAFTRDELSASGRARLLSIERADALVVGSPVYKGSYTGLFKHVFDLIEPEHLLGKPVLLIATGGGHRHALVVEHQLRPLFGFFGALTVPTSVYAAPVDFAEDGALKGDLGQRLKDGVDQLVSFIGSRELVTA